MHQVLPTSLVLSALKAGLRQAGLGDPAGQGCAVPARAAHPSFQVLDPTGQGGRSSSPVIYKCLLTRAVSEGGLGCTVSDQRYKKSPGFQEH